MVKKKSSLFSSVKRCFTSNKKKKTDKKRSKKGDWGYVETKSFVPFFRAPNPSSIEKILGEADQLNIQPRVSLESVKIIEKSALPKSVSPKAVSTRACDLYPENTIDDEAFLACSSDPSSNGTEANVNITKPASFLTPGTGYRSDLYLENSLNEEFLTGLDPLSNGTERNTVISYAKMPVTTARDDENSALKIQTAYRGYLARRSFRALKGLMRLQVVMRGQNVKRQTTHAMKQMQLLVRVQTQIRLQRLRSPEHILRNQRYFVDKGPESSFSKRSMNRYSSGSVRNEDWDYSSITKEEKEARLQKKVKAVIKRERAMAYTYSQQQQNSNPRSSQSPQNLTSDRYPWRWNWFDRKVDVSENSIKSFASTPRRASSEYNKSPQLHSKCYKHRGNETPLKDDDSLMSCPTFVYPRYMTPTVSAMMKVQENRNRNERFPGTPNSERRFSFPLTPNKDSASQPGRRQSVSPRSIRSSGVSSSVSTSALVGRKPFNRF